MNINLGGPRQWALIADLVLHAGTAVPTPPLFSCAAYKPDEPYNMNAAGFCDPQIDRQIAHATAQQTTSAAAADRAGQHIDREIMQRVPWIPLVNLVGIDLVSAKVGNHQRTTAFGVLLDQLWVAN